MLLYVSGAKDTMLGAFVLKFHACRFYDFTDVTGSNLSGLAVQFAMHFVNDCYSKFSSVATFSIAMCHKIA